MKNNQKLIYLSAFLVLALCLSSCNLPIKNAAKIQTTTPPPVTITPSPQPTIDSTEATPTPEKPLTFADIVPVTGSVLTWIDFSNFVYVPAGEFDMGVDSSTTSDHFPAHTVTIGGFWIHQAEVTNQQYAACVAAGICTVPSKEDDTPYWYAKADKVNAPVVGVTWLQANQYCDFIEARLPTEAEWEKTARGFENSLYPWGEDSPNCDLLNYNDCLDPSEPEDVRTYNNGASEFLAMDMAGNVNEWVNDWYAKDYYASSPVSNPVGPIDGIKKVYRGGSYSSSMDEVNPVMRNSVKPQEHAADLGFRCVLLGEAEAISVPPPACQVPAFAQQPDSGPTGTPAPQVVDFKGYCHWGTDGYKHLTVYVDPLNECTLKRMRDFTLNIPNDPLNISCPLEDGLGCGGDDINCYSPYFVEGGTYEINYCFDDCNWGELEPECAQGFDYNTGTGWCEPVSNWLPEPPCPDGYEEFPNLGCLPDYEAFEGCPVGYYTAGINGTYPACVPVNECLLPGADESCGNPFCTQGQSYDAENQCCAVPQKWKAICPTGYYLDSDMQLCIQSDWCSTGCQTSSVTIPFCPTPTPSPTPVKTICSNITDKNTCKASGCDWVVPVSGGPQFCR